MRNKGFNKPYFKSSIDKQKELFNVVNNVPHYSHTFIDKETIDESVNKIISYLKDNGFIKNRPDIYVMYFAAYDLKEPKVLSVLNDHNGHNATNEQTNANEINKQE